MMLRIRGTRMLHFFEQSFELAQLVDCSKMAAGCTFWSHRRLMHTVPRSYSKFLNPNVTYKQIFKSMLHYRSCQRAVHDSKLAIQFSGKCEM